ncbi:hypothetical protein VTK56DRAFT_2123 [Thermocarpiscus australiensis]
MSFFAGSLQEGIAAALQQAKSVVCFVTDGEAESQQWEDEFFTEEEVLSLLQSQAVTLRLPAGSQEETYLAQLYPIPKKPTAVIIKNAELKEYIAAGVTKEEFVRRIKTALAPAQPAGSPQSAAAPTSPAAPTNQQSRVDDVPAGSSGQATRTPSSDSRVQLLLAERAARLAEQKKKQEEEAKRQRAEKAKAKAQAEADGSRKPDEQSKHAEALRKKQREAREERQRILKAIEDDKAARRARKAELEAERKAAAAAALENQNTAPFSPASQLLPSTGRLSEHCSIQVRLFDGSTIRSRFSSNDTLKDVRQWVDTTRKDGKEPYTFKVLLTPLPSKTIDVTEEGKSLQSLELAPSSTLILVRVPKSTAARTSSAAPAVETQGNVFQRLIAYILAIVTGIFNAISAFFTTLFSTRAPPAAQEHPASRTSQSQVGADAARRRGRRIAGLDRADERRNEQQFYNGNSTNFEPNPEDGD